MPILASLLAAALPMLVYLYFIWNMDKYEREPVLFLLLHFLWGAIGAIVLGLVGSLLLGSISGISELEIGSIIQTVFFAPLSEEIAKGIFLLFTVTSKKFDNATDGLVYGGAIGLGFGMTENFTYFISYGTNAVDWWFLVIIRSGFSAVMHAIATATFGATLGLAKFSLSKIKSLYPIAGLIMAILFHLLWNASVSFEETFVYGFVFMFLLIWAFIGIFKLSVSIERKIILNELLEESEFNLLPKEHIQIIGSRQRMKPGWIDESIRKQYFRAAIKLAFAKMQSKKSNGYFHHLYANEVENGRREIKFLLDSIGGNS